MFRWSVVDGRTSLGTLPATFGPQNWALKPSDISNDGSTIIGKIDGGFLGVGGGFVWTAAGGVVPILDSPDGSIHRAIPIAVSADGSVVVGDALQDQGPGNSHHVPFRWTPSSGTTSLGFDGSPQKISDDGTVIAGTRKLTEQTSEAFRWTEATGVTSLGHFPSTLPSSSVWTMSDDGDVIFGGSFSGDSFSGPRGFRWTEAAAMEVLSPRGDDHFAYATSANGEVAIGLMRTLVTDASGPRINGEEFVWTAAGGLETLSEFLVSRGLTELEPIKSPTNFDVLNDVSADGQVLFGASGTFVYVDGQYIVGVEHEYWLLDLAVPEPSTLGFGILAAILAISVRCQRRPRGQKQGLYKKPLTSTMSGVVFRRYIAST